MPNNDPLLIFNFKFLLLLPIAHNNNPSAQPKLDPNNIHPHIAPHPNPSTIKSQPINVKLNSDVKYHNKSFIILNWFKVVTVSNISR